MADCNDGTYFQDQRCVECAPESWCTAGRALPCFLSSEHRVSCRATKGIFPVYGLWMDSGGLRKELIDATNATRTTATEHEVKKWFGTYMQECRAGDCTGARQGERCRQNQLGVLCAECKLGFTKSLGRCLKCDEVP